MEVTRELMGLVAFGRVSWVALLIGVTSLLWGAASAVTEELHATVVRVIDGDTLVVDVGRESVTVRLTGVNAFEVRRTARLREQALRAGISDEEALRRGKEAQRALAEYLTPGSKVLLRVRRATTRDVYGRMPAVVYLAGATHMSVNEALRVTGLLEESRE